MKLDSPQGQQLLLTSYFPKPTKSYARHTVSACDDLTNPTLLKKKKKHSERIVAMA